MYVKQINLSLKCDIFDKQLLYCDCENIDCVFSTLKPLKKELLYLITSIYLQHIVTFYSATIYEIEFLFNRINTITLVSVICMY